MGHPNHFTKKKKSIECQNNHSLTQNFKDFILILHGNFHVKLDLCFILM